MNNQQIFDRSIDLFDSGLTCGMCLGDNLIKEHLTSFISYCELPFTLNVNFSILNEITFLKNLECIYEGIDKINNKQGFAQECQRLAVLTKNLTKKTWPESLYKLGLYYKLDVSKLVSYMNHSNIKISEVNSQIKEEV